MKPIFSVGLGARLVCLLLPLQAGLTDFSPAPAIMFRGNPEHSGFSPGPLFDGQGGMRWRLQTGGSVRSTPAVTPTRVYVGSGDGSLYSIDRATGKIAWKFPAGAPVDASPAVAGGLVVAATLSGRIFAVDQHTGRLRWSMQTGPALPPNTSPAGGWDLWASSPTVLGSRIVIGGQDGVIYALDLSSGKKLWGVATGGRVRATPAIHNGLVVVGSWNGRIYGLDLKSGAERWVHRTVGDTIDSRKAGYDRRAVQSSAAVADGMVFVGSRDGAIYGLDEATGERRWRVSHQGSWVIGSPAVHEGRVYVGSSDGHYAQALDGKTGRELWRLPTAANVLASPLALGNAVVLATARTDAGWGDLLTVDPASGTVLWRLRLDEATNSSPVAADGELYLGTEGGSVIAVHQVNSAVPRLAVFYDSTSTAEPSAAGGRLALEYFRQLGYEVLGASTLAGFLADRIRDDVPSAVVFAMDVLPPEVASDSGHTSLLRRYLNSGGKVVSFSVPLGAAVRDSAGKFLGEEPKRIEAVLGVSSASMDYDEALSTPTPAGTRWGIIGRIRGDYPIAPSAVSQALALNPHGMATAWVRSYRPDRPGSGYVQLWGLGATLERLPLVRAVTEYGLLRAASPAMPS